MPTPGANESEKDFIKRCVPIVMAEGNTKDNKQAVAICYSMWKRKDKADLAEFSLVIRSVGLNKKTGQRYWKASTSDIYPDSYNDEMSLDLYNSFLDKIKGDVKPPEHFRSESWDGGMPYVSVSHYREHSIAGDTERVYVDGAVLKANGTFRETPLGLACFNTLCTEKYSKEGEGKEPVRISIAFLDYKHQHKANGFIFERSEIDEPCPECMKERLERDYSGRVFLDGLLIHFAMTRVPVNQRTLMEVEKSMTTRKEDASSIIGEELAEELEDKEKSLVGKSEAIIIKAEDEPIVEPVVENILSVTEEVKSTTLEDVLAKISTLESILLAKVKKDEEEPVDDKGEEEEEKKKKKKVEEEKSHPLAESLAQLRSDFDSVALMEASTAERLQAIQDSFNAVGLRIRELLSVEEKSVPASTDDKLLEVLQKMNDKLDLISAQKSQAVLPTSIPSPRSISPARVVQLGQQPEKRKRDPNDATPPFLRSLIDKSVGLD